MTNRIGQWPCVVMAAAFALLTGHSAPAFAQQAQVAGTGLEEIVVTARKRAELIQTVPLAITAFTSDDLDKRNARGVKDIASLTPGFNFEDFGGFGNTAPVIRGAAQIANTVAAEQAVSFFLDGVYLPRSYLTDMGFAGIDRLEVVKGPQSARYSENAFMGAVNYISKKPTDDWHAEVEGTAGIYNQYSVSGDVSGPIVKGKADFLIGASKSVFDGSWKNLDPNCDVSWAPDKGTGCRLGGYNKTSYNAALHFTPTDKLTLDIEYFNFLNNNSQGANSTFGELNENSQVMNCGQYNPNVRPAGSGLGGGGAWFRLYCGQIPIVTNTQFVDPRGYAANTKADFARVALSYEINDALRFDYVYGRVSGHTLNAQYGDTPTCTYFLPNCVISNGGFETNLQESHDVRLSYDNKGMIRGSVGFLYAPDRDYFNDIFGTIPGPLTTLPTAPIDPRVASNFLVYAVLFNSITKNQIYSPFGEVNVNFLDNRLRVGAEARWTHENRVFQTVNSGGAGGLAAILGANYAATYNYFTPRFTVDYDLTKENLLYASAAKGVKPGGFNPSSFLPQNKTFAPDSNWTYEIGSKNTFGNYRINADVFLYKWKNMQVPAADPGNPAPLPIVITLNLGNVTGKGIELENEYAFTKQFTVNANAYLGDPKFDKGTYDLNDARTPAICDNVVCPTSGYIGGKTLPRASKFMLTAGAEWRDDLPFGTDMKYYARGDVSYQSKTFADDMDLSWAQARALVNANIGITAKAYEVFFWVKNLLDKQYVSSASITQPNVGYYGALGDRRTLGITAKFRY